MTSFFQSVGQDPLVSSHFSSIGLAKAFEELLDLEGYKLVEPYIRITEQAEAQQIALQNEEDTMVGVGTASGMGSDYDEDLILSETAEVPV